MAKKSAANVEDAIITELEGAGGEWSTGPEPKPEAPKPRAAKKAEPPAPPLVYPYRVKCKCRWRFTVNRPGRYACPECGNAIVIG